MSIPSMTSRHVLDFLRTVGRLWHGRGVAVECGCWLGASMVALAEGLVSAGYDRPLYCFDAWKATASEVQKAADAGVQIEPGQNLEPVFRANVEPVYADLACCRGRIEDAQRCGEPIGIFLLDAAKTQPEFGRTLRTFGPHWVDGAMVGLMDFNYWRKFDGARRAELRCQVEFVERHGKHLGLCKDWPTASPAFFWYLGGIDWTREEAG